MASTDMPGKADNTDVDLYDDLWGEATSGGPAVVASLPSQDETDGHTAETMAGLDIYEDMIVENGQQQDGVTEKSSGESEVHAKSQQNNMADLDLYDAMLTADTGKDFGGVKSVEKALEHISPENQTDFDLYDDMLVEEDRKQTQSFMEMQQKLQEALKIISGLEVDNSTLRETVKTQGERSKVMEKNLSSLLLTAKGEISRKDREINQLRKRIEGRGVQSTNGYRRGGHTSPKRSNEANSKSNNTASPSSVGQTRDSPKKHSVDKCDSLNRHRHRSSSNRNDERSQEVKRDVFLSGRDKASDTSVEHEGNDVRTIHFQRKHDDRNHSGEKQKERKYKCSSGIILTTDSSSKHTESVGRKDANLKKDDINNIEGKEKEISSKMSRADRMPVNDSATKWTSDADVKDRYSQSRERNRSGERQREACGMDKSISNEDCVAYTLKSPPSRKRCKESNDGKTKSNNRGEIKPIESRNSIHSTGRRHGSSDITDRHTAIESKEGDCSKTSRNRNNERLKDNRKDTTKESKQPFHRSDTKHKHEIENTRENSQKTSMERPGIKSAVQVTSKGQRVRNVTSDKSPQQLHDNDMFQISPRKEALPHQRKDVKVFDLREILKKKRMSKTVDIEQKTKLPTFDEKSCDAHQKSVADHTMAHTSCLMSKLNANNKQHFTNTLHLQNQSNEPDKDKNISVTHTVAENECEVLSEQSKHCQNDVEASACKNSVQQVQALQFHDDCMKTDLDIANVEKHLSSDLKTKSTAHEHINKPYGENFDATVHEHSTIKTGENSQDDTGVKANITNDQNINNSIDLKQNCNSEAVEDNICHISGEENIVATNSFAHVEEPNGRISKENVNVIALKKSGPKENEDIVKKEQCKLDEMNEYIYETGTSNYFEMNDKSNKSDRGPDTHAEEYLCMVKQNLELSSVHDNEDNCLSNQIRYPKSLICVPQDVEIVNDGCEVAASDEGSVAMELDGENFLKTQKNDIKLDTSHRHSVGGNGSANTSEMVENITVSGKIKSSNCSEENNLASATQEADLIHQGENMDSCLKSASEKNARTVAEEVFGPMGDSSFETNSEDSSSESCSSDSANPDVISAKKETLLSEPQMEPIQQTHIDNIHARSSYQGDNTCSHSTSANEETEGTQRTHCNDSETIFSPVKPTHPRCGVQGCQTIVKHMHPKKMMGSNSTDSIIEEKSSSISNTDESIDHHASGGTSCSSISKGSLSDSVLMHGSLTEMNNNNNDSETSQELYSSGSRKKASVGSGSETNSFTDVCSALESQKQYDLNPQSAFDGAGRIVSSTPVSWKVIQSERDMLEPGKIPKTILQKISREERLIDKMSPERYVVSETISMHTHFSDSVAEMLDHIENKRKKLTADDGPDRKHHHSNKDKQIGGCCIPGCKMKAVHTHPVCKTEETNILVGERQIPADCSSDKSCLMTNVSNDTDSPILNLTPDENKTMSVESAGDDPVQSMDIYEVFSVSKDELKRLSDEEANKSLNAVHVDLKDKVTSSKDATHEDEQCNGKAQCSSQAFNEFVLKQITLSRLQALNCDDRSVANDTLNEDDLSSKSMNSSSNSLNESKMEIVENKPIVDVEIKCGDESADNSCDKTYCSSRENIKTSMHETVSPFSQSDSKEPVIIGNNSVVSSNTNVEHQLKIERDCSSDNLMKKSKEFGCRRESSNAVSNSSIPLTDIACVETSKATNCANEAVDKDSEHAVADTSLCGSDESFESNSVSEKNSSVLSPSSNVMSMECSDFSDSEDGSVSSSYSSSVEGDDEDSSDSCSEDHSDDEKERNIQHVTKHCSDGDSICQNVEALSDTKSKGTEMEVITLSTSTVEEKIEIEEQDVTHRPTDTKYTNFCSKSCDQEYSKLSQSIDNGTNTKMLSGESPIKSTLLQSLLHQVQTEVETKACDRICMQSIKCSPTAAIQVKRKCVEETSQHVISNTSFEEPVKESLDLKNNVNFNENTCANQDSGERERNEIKKKMKLLPADKVEEEGFSENTDKHCELVGLKSNADVACTKQTRNVSTVPSVQDGSASDSSTTDSSCEETDDGNSSSDSSCSSDSSVSSSYCSTCSSSDCSTCSSSSDSSSESSSHSMESMMQPLPNSLPSPCEQCNKIDAVPLKNVLKCESVCVRQEKTIGPSENEYENLGGSAAASVSTSHAVLQTQTPNLISVHSNIKLKSNTDIERRQNASVVTSISNSSVNAENSNSGKGFQAKQDKNSFNSESRTTDNPYFIDDEKLNFLTDDETSKLSQINSKPLLDDDTKNDRHHTEQNALSVVSPTLIQCDKESVNEMHNKPRQDCKSNVNCEQHLSSADKKVITPKKVRNSTQVHSRNKYDKSSDLQKMICSPQKSDKIVNKILSATQVETVHLRRSPRKIPARSHDISPRKVCDNEKIKDRYRSPRKRMKGEFKSQKSPLPSSSKEINQKFNPKRSDCKSASVKGTQMKGTTDHSDKAEKELVDKIMKSHAKQAEMTKKQICEKYEAKLWESTKKTKESSPRTSKDSLKVSSVQREIHSSKSDIRVSGLQSNLPKVGCMNRLETKSFEDILVSGDNFKALRAKTATKSRRTAGKFDQLSSPMKNFTIPKKSSVKGNSCYSSKVSKQKERSKTSTLNDTAVGKSYSTELFDTNARSKDRKRRTKYSHADQYTSYNSNNAAESVNNSGKICPGMETTDKDVNIRCKVLSDVLGSKLEHNRRSSLEKGAEVNVSDEQLEKAGVSTKDNNDGEKMDVDLSSILQQNEEPEVNTRKKNLAADVSAQTNEHAIPDKETPLQSIKNKLSSEAEPEVGPNGETRLQNEAFDGDEDIEVQSMSCHTAARSSGDKRSSVSQDKNKKAHCKTGPLLLLEENTMDGVDYHDDLSDQFSEPDFSSGADQKDGGNDLESLPANSEEENTEEGELSSSDAECFDLNVNNTVMEQTSVKETTPKKSSLKACFSPIRFPESNKATTSCDEKNSPATITNKRRQIVEYDSDTNKYSLTEKLSNGRFDDSSKLVTATKTNRRPRELRTAHYKGRTSPQRERRRSLTPPRRTRPRSRSVDYKGRRSRSMSPRQFNRKSGGRSFLSFKDLKESKRRNRSPRRSRFSGRRRIDRRHVLSGYRSRSDSYDRDRRDTNKSCYSSSQDRRSGTPEADTRDLGNRNKLNADPSSEKKVSSNAHHKAETTDQDSPVVRYQRRKSCKRLRSSTESSSNEIEVNSGQIPSSHNAELSEKENLSSPVSKRSRTECNASGRNHTSDQPRIRRK